MNTPQEDAKPVEIEVTTVEPQAEDTKQNVRVEEFSVNGDALVGKIKELIHQGNIRRITIKNEEGHTLIEIPLTIGVVGGVVGTAIFPLVAAIGAIGALVAHLTIAIEKVEDS
ncbi:DUF4342 domain-containing protein [Aerosakkonemataceae cyanobacterium BLCC-F154]|uniref:DUF4342 domain-containing protein n=1 Tax=Floridaenema fluviatile BLCC-F154 TaxID=3153640 RepID=A0ABV4YE66_9CYAN